jgi:phosphoglycolate phosphatase-like HAD superfamily hydrolase
MNLAVFDIDGTLIVPNRVEDACFLDALRTAFGFEDVDPDWTRYEDVTDSGVPNQLCMQRWGRRPTVEELRRFRDVYSASFIERLAPGDGGEIPGAGAFLKKLRSHPEWRLAIATGNFIRLAFHKLRHAGLAASDLPIASADDAPRRSDLIRLAVARAQDEYCVASFEHVVSIGDAPWDLRTARELQMPFVAIGPRCGARSSGSTTIDDYVDDEGVLLHLRRAVCW